MHIPSKITGRPATPRHYPDTGTGVLLHFDHVGGGRGGQLADSWWTAAGQLLDRTWWSEKERRGA